MYEEKNMARDIMRQAFTGKIPPQGVVQDAIRPDLRIASENLSA
jgi:hypothetical protein